MKKPLIIVGLCILGLFFASFDFQNSNAGVTQYLKKVEGFIGEPFSYVQTELGEPDFQTSDSNVLIYYVKDKSGEITGYRQFGNWEGEVGCYSERNTVPEEQVMSLYQQVIAHMREGGSTVDKVSMSGSPYDFTDNHRISRRLDTMWEVDMRLQYLDSNINYYVYERDKRACHLELLIEAKRIEDKLGL